MPYAKNQGIRVRLILIQMLFFCAKYAFMRYVSCVCFQTEKRECGRV